MSKTAAVVVDWAKISTKLGLPKGERTSPSPPPPPADPLVRAETLSALSAFRKRAAEARLHNSQLKDHKTEIDFEHYRAILKNKAVVAEGEKLFAAFKPADYDVSAQLKVIAAFETKAVESAKETASKIQVELGNLNTTLHNIENARPFDQLSLDDVAAARPEITKAVETMISKGKWTVPGYVEKFGVRTHVSSASQSDLTANLTFLLRSRVPVEPQYVASLFVDRVIWI